MRRELRAVVIAIVLAGSGAVASAQTGSPAGGATDRLNLTQAQETTILLRVEKERPQEVPAPLSVGDTVPDALSLKPLPSDVGAQIPEAERFHYAKLDDGVVLVDPGSNQVVRFIRAEAAATGGLPATGTTTMGAGTAR